MRIVMFYHSLISDWNHGNAHFLRGIVSELMARGHDVPVFEPRDAWSVQNLLAEYGPDPIRKFEAAYRELTSNRYDLATFDPDFALDGADMVIVHEWNDHSLVQQLGLHRARSGRYRLLFHDTHHRSVTDPKSMAAYDLRHYDGVLAYGKVIRDIYLDNGWAQRAWTWHEAADTHVFRPRADGEKEGEIVWIGNWGDDERTAELREFLIEPVKTLGLKARIYGVRYPEAARELMRDVGIEYAGWLPNYMVPRVFSKFRLTVHIPRRPYVEALPGIPTIRPFEALACGIPLVCSAWEDAEGLFTPGEDYLIAGNGEEMKRHISDLLSDDAMAREIAFHGYKTILARHTCAHRVDELLAICESLGINTKIPAPAGQVQPPNDPEGENRLLTSERNPICHKA